MSIKKRAKIRVPPAAHPSNVKGLIRGEELLLYPGTIWVKLKKYDYSYNAEMLVTKVVIQNIK